MHIRKKFLDFDVLNWVEVAPDIDDDILMGYKEHSFMEHLPIDSQLIYCPYIPITIYDSGSQQIQAQSDAQ